MPKSKSTASQNPALKLIPMPMLILLLTLTFALPLGQVGVALGAPGESQLAGNPAQTGSTGPLVITPVKTPGSAEEQKKKAKDLYTVMMNTDANDLETLERLHLQVIQECPECPLAEKSIWMLSNLYEFASDQPLVEKQVVLLEFLNDRYPGSPMIPALMNRMLNAYRALNRPDKLVAVYADALARPDVEDRAWVLYGLDYAKALEQTGSRTDARAALQEVIRRDGTKGSFEAGVARSLLEKWK